MIKNMKKGIENKVKKILEKECIDLKYCTGTASVFVNDVKMSNSKIKAEPFFDKLKKKLNINDKELITLIIEYAQLNKFDSKDIKQAKIKAEKEAKQAEKRAEIEQRTNNMEDWEKDMILDKDGFIDRFQKRNMYTFFKKFPKFNGKFKYNNFSGIETYDSQLIEPHIVTALSLITEEYIGNTNESWVSSTTNVICHENEYNPIISALDMLPPWDDVARMETYFIDYVGADDNKLNRSMTKKWFYALFERLFYPGCNFDHMLITYDETHGTGKTTLPITLLQALQTLANNSTEDSGIISLNNLGFDKDNIQCLNKAWIAYVDELAKFVYQEPEDVKKFITLTTDNARLSYARLNKNFPRHCVFYGSTNTNEFIKDYTDELERRFWIIDCHGTKHESEDYWNKKLPYETKLQILAEAYQFWKDNPDYNYNELDEEDNEALRVVQEGHTTANKDRILGNDLNAILWFDYTCPDDYEHYYEWKNEVDIYWSKYKSASKYEQNKYKTAQNFLESDEKVIKNDEKTHKNIINFDKKLHKIPSDWVIQLIQDEFGRKILDPKYIERCLGKDWNYNANAYYNDIRRCFVRVL